MAHNAEADTRWVRGARLALAACVVATLLATGARLSFGAFVRPIEADLGLDRGALSLVGAAGLLTHGLIQPLFGWLSIRIGPQRTMQLGILLLVVGTVGAASATAAWQLLLFAGLVFGLGFAGTSGVPATHLLAMWYQRRLGSATGVLSAGIPGGQTLFVPLAVALIPLLGWRNVYLLIGALLLLIALPAVQIFAREPGGVEAPTAAQKPMASRRAGLDVWLVGAGYAACGFTDQFVSIHLVPLAIESGLDPLVAAGVTSALMLFGILGSVLSGPVADRARPHVVLATLYLLRVASLPLLLLGGPGLGLLPFALFALVFGATYISNQAPGARLVRDRYGLQAVAPLMAGVGLAHQVGGALGIAIGGFSVVATGSYGAAIVISTLVVLVGGLAQFFIPRAQRTAAPA